MEQIVTTVEPLEGSVRYTPPEVVNDLKEVTIKSDVWQLGCVILEMITGREPFSEFTEFNLDAVLRKLKG